MAAVIAYAMLAIFAVMSVLQLVEWRKVDSFVAKRFQAEGMYAAPEASSAAWQWAVFGAFCAFLSLPFMQLGVHGAAVFAAMTVAFACLVIGTVIWLFMPDSFLVPRAFRGAPGYLAVRGIM